jgi:hypothetical protein
MKPLPSVRKHKPLAPFGILLIAFAFVLVIGLACNTPDTENANKTQIALNVKATHIAEQTQTAEALAAEAEREAQAKAAEIDHQATSDAQATQMAVDVQNTVNAQQATQNAQVTDTPEPSNTPEPSETPKTETSSGGQSQPPPQPSTNTAEFEAWMRQEASVLLYEDMTGDFTVSRVIKLALDRMGIKQYVDVRDAIGNYKTQLLSAGPGGQGWDLIISGKERRSSVQGEFYVYLNDALNLGSSVIIEEWDMDGIASGTIAGILSRCGVQFFRDWIDEPLDEQLLFPIDGTNPIHHFPNEGISLTNPSGFWLFFDLGDLMKLRPGSSAKALWGARSNVSDSYLTAVSCLDNQLIIQTYSSHSYGQDRIVLMWQNYIYNALKARYDSTH